MKHRVCLAVVVLLIASGLASSAGTWHPKIAPVEPLDLAVRGPGASPDGPPE